MNYKQHPVTVVGSLRAKGYLGLLILIAIVGLLGCNSSGGGGSDGGCETAANTNLQVVDPVDPAPSSTKYCSDTRAGSILWAMDRMSDGTTGRRDLFRMAAI